MKYTNVVLKNVLYAIWIPDHEKLFFGTPLFEKIILSCSDCYLGSTNDVKVAKSQILLQSCPPNHRLHNKDEEVTTLEIAIPKAMDGEK